MLPFAFFSVGCAPRVLKDIINKLVAFPANRHRDNHTFVTGVLKEGWEEQPITAGMCNKDLLQTSSMNKGLNLLHRFLVTRRHMNLSHGVVACNNHCAQKQMNREDVDCNG